MIEGIDMLIEEKKLDEVIELLKEIKALLTRGVIIAPTNPLPNPQGPFPSFPQPKVMPLQFGDQCIDLNGHDFPMIWHGIVPPPCSKCGKTSGAPWTI